MIPRLLLTFCLVLSAGSGRLSAAETLPPAPRQYVTDEAGVISPGVVADLNRQLAAFEKATSNQIVAVVYPNLPEGASLEDYTQRLYEAWHIGQKKTSNGILLLVSVQSRKVRIQSGYGLEGAMPDAICNRIIRETMVPAFRTGNYNAGLSAGITAVMQATKGEYKGTGGTGQRAHKPTTLLDLLFSPLGLFLLVMLVLVISNRGRRDAGGGISPGTAAATGFFLGGGGGGWGGEGGGSGGDGGGFSGGGGDSGGGGSSGDW